MTELGLEVAPQPITDHYAGVIDAMLIDERDPSPDPAPMKTDTLMLTLADRARVAKAALALAEMSPSFRRGRGAALE